MNKPYPPPPVRPRHSENAENSENSENKNHSIKSKLLCYSLPFSEGLLQSVAGLLPKKPYALAGEWENQPPRESADYVLWRVGAFLKHDNEAKEYGAEDFRPLINMISDYLKIDLDDGWRLFVKAYDKARVGSGASSQLLQAAKLNAQDDINRRTDCEYIGQRPIYVEDRRRLLVGIFFHLLRGGKPGERFLTTRAAGSLIGASSATAGEWIKAMVRDGYLVEIKKGNEFSAPRYRWIDC